MQPRGEVTRRKCCNLRHAKRGHVTAVELTPMAHCAGKSDQLLGAHIGMQLLREVAGGGVDILGHAQSLGERPRVPPKHDHLQQPHHGLRAGRPPGQGTRLVPPDADEWRRARLHHLQVPCEHFPCACSLLGWIKQNIGHLSLAGCLPACDCVWRDSRQSKACEP